MADSAMASPPAVEDQARLLEDALIMVRQQTHLMRKCLETPGKLMDALKCRYTSLIPPTRIRPCSALTAVSSTALLWCPSCEPVV